MQSLNHFAGGLGLWLPVICTIDVQGDCAIAPFSKTGRTILSRVTVFSKVWEQPQLKEAEALSRVSVLRRA